MTIQTQTTKNKQVNISSFFQNVLFNYKLYLCPFI